MSFVDGTTRSRSQSNSKDGVVCSTHRRRVNISINVNNVSEGMKKLYQAGAFTYPNFERDKIIATRLFEQDRLEPELIEFLKRVESKQRYHEGDATHFLLAAMRNGTGSMQRASASGEFHSTYTYPGWTRDMEYVKRVFLSSANAFAESDTRRLLRAMMNKQTIYDGNDLPNGILMLQSISSKSSSDSDDFYHRNDEFGRLRRNAINAYIGGYDDVFEKCIEDIRKMQMIGIDIGEKESRGGYRRSRILQLSPIVEAGESRISSSAHSSRMSSLDISSTSPASRKLLDISDEQQYIEMDESQHSIYAIPGILDTIKPSHVQKGAVSLSEQHVDANTEEIQDIAVHSKDKNTNRSVLCAVDPSVISPERSSLKPSTCTGDDPIDTTNVRPYLSPCAICLESVTTHLFVPCGHLALCSRCATNPPYKTKNGRKRVRHRCPICRKESREVIKVFY